MPISFVKIRRKGSQTPHSLQITLFLQWFFLFFHRYIPNHSPLYSPEKRLVERSPKNPESQPQIEQIEGGKSNLSNYGSSSLKNLGRISDQDIVAIQRKNFNIITLNDRNQKGGKNGKRSQEMERKESLYMGVSTIQQNLREEVKQRIKNRPYYLNNADEIQF